jgi:predicted PurR-regulated permease PerM
MARPAPQEEVPFLLRAAAGWAWRLLVLVGAVWVLGQVARKLELAVVPLLAAVLLSALLQPVNARLQRLRLGRGFASVLTVLLAVTVLGGVGAFVANRAIAGYPQLVDEINHLVVRTQDWLVTGPLHLDRDSVTHVGSKLVDYLRSRQGQLVTSAVSAGRVALDLVTALVLTFFLTIFLLYDGRNVFVWATGFIPAHAREKVDEVGERMWATVSGYVVGTFLVALFHGVVMGVTLALVGVPLVAPLAVLIFLGGFVPLIGAVVFGGLAVLVTLVAKGATAALVVLVVLLVENQVESHVLQPFVVGRHVSLHPMAIALTLACGALLAGLPGAIFGVPLVAALNAAGKALRPVAATP